MNFDKGNNKLYYRLIALWVVSEAFAGGIMHASRIPFTGMIVSSLAVTCIIMIGYYVPGKGVILKATLIVAAFKLLLSPFSPPTSYIAIGFQGYLGALLLNRQRYFTVSAVILAVLSLVESAIQRILVLWVIYGSTFWKAINEFVHKLAGGQDRNYSFFIAACYILLHAVAGIFTGLYATRLARKCSQWIPDPSYVINKNAFFNEPVNNKRKEKKIKWVLLIIWAFLLFLLLDSWLDPIDPLLQTGVVVNILLRSALIVLSWFLLISPLLMHIIEKRLSKKLEELKGSEVMQILPQTRYILVQSWQLSAKKSGRRRIKLFLKILMYNIVFDYS